MENHITKISASGNVGDPLSRRLAHTDEYFMHLALEEAQIAASHGEVPVGALLVHGDQIVAKSHNEREWRQDPTAHAELYVIKEAASRLGSWRLEETTLFVTLEPCLMCAGAMLQARIPRLVFGAWDPKAGACGSLFTVHHDPRLNHQITVMNGILEEECRSILQTFFRQLRQPETQINNV